MAVVSISVTLEMRLKKSPQVILKNSNYEFFKLKKVNNLT
jgi:hypothetical protein